MLKPHIPFSPQFQMGSHLIIHFFNSISIPIPQNYFRSFSNNNNYRYCVSDRAKGRSYLSGGSRWNWSTSATPNKRSRFSDPFATDGFDDDVEEFGSSKRIWWSDGFDDDDDDEEDFGFGFVQWNLGSIDFSWLLKVFQAFGWMIPAVVISLLFGTQSNAMIPALALPLAQSAFSLVSDALWGKSSETPRPKSKRKKRPFARAAGNTRERRRRGNGTQPKKESGDYKSWVDANNVSGKHGKKGSKSFGGWDEL